MIQQGRICTEWETCRRPVTPTPVTASDNENSLVTPLAVAGSCLLLVILLLAAFFASRKRRGTTQPAGRTRTVEPSAPEPARNVEAQETNPSAPPLQIISPEQPPTYDEISAPPYPATPTLPVRPTETPPPPYQ